MFKNSKEWHSHIHSWMEIKKYLNWRLLQLDELAMLLRFCEYVESFFDFFSCYAIDCERKEWRCFRWNRKCDTCKWQIRINQIEFPHVTWHLKDGDAHISWTRTAKIHNLLHISCLSCDSIVRFHQFDGFSSVIQQRCCYDSHGNGLNNIIVLPCTTWGNYMAFEWLEQPFSWEEYLVKPSAK